MQQQQVLTIFPIFLILFSAWEGREEGVGLLEWGKPVAGSSPPQAVSLHSTCTLPSILYLAIYTQTHKIGTERAAPSSAMAQNPWCPHKAGDAAQNQQAKTTVNPLLFSFFYFPFYKKK